MEITQNTVKAGRKVHTLITVKEYDGYGLLAVTGCNITVPVEGIGHHDEVTCGNCKKKLAK